MKRIPRALVAAAVAVGVLAGIAGCAALDDGPRTTESLGHGATGVIYVVPVHRNGPQAAFTQSDVDRTTAAIQQHKPIGVIGVAGSPQVLLPAAVVTLTSTGSGAIENETAGDVGQLEALLAAARPQTNGADLLAALEVAATAAHSSTPAIHTLVVSDNGISDSASALDFTQPGMTDANPAEVVRQLLGEGLKRDTFAGLTVEFTGLGNTALPQRPLSEVQKQGIDSVYAAVVASGGGKADIATVPVDGISLKTSKTVGVVKPEHPTVGVLSDRTLGFGPGSSVITNPSSAATALRPWAQEFTSCTTTALLVTGRVSSAGSTGTALSRAQDRALSLARAGRVRALLIQLGADGSCVRSEGLGYTASPPDTKAGRLLPGAAAQNRRTDLTVVNR